MYIYTVYIPILYCKYTIQSAAYSILLFALFVCNAARSLWCPKTFAK